MGKIGVPYVHSEVVLEDTCYTFHSEKIYQIHQFYKYRILSSDTDSYPRHQRDCILNRCTENYLKFLHNQIQTN